LRLTGLGPKRWHSPLCERTSDPIAQVITNEVPLLTKYRADGDTCRASTAYQSQRGQRCLSGLDAPDTVFDLDGQAFTAYLANDAATLDALSARLHAPARRFGHYWHLCTGFSGSAR
jgi:hypothetical protein